MFVNLVVMRNIKNKWNGKMKNNSPLYELSRKSRNAGNSPNAVDTCPQRNSASIKESSKFIKSAGTLNHSASAVKEKKAHSPQGNSKRQVGWNSTCTTKPAGILNKLNGRNNGNNN